MGGHAVAELAAMFSVSRATAYRILRNGVGNSETAPAVRMTTSSFYNEGECGVTAQHTEPDEPQTEVPVRELRRLRALARIASPQELAEAEEAARIEELDAFEAAGRTGDLSDQRARRILGIPDRRGDEEYLTTDEVRRRLGLPG
jgi:hypothetical protein